MEAVNFDDLRRVAAQVGGGFRRRDLLFLNMRIPKAVPHMPKDADLMRTAPKETTRSILIRSVRVWELRPKKGVCPRVERGVLLKLRGTEWVRDAQRMCSLAMTKPLLLLL